jgi:hypothetical protein
MVVQDAESCYGCIIQIFESLKKSQTQDMSAIQTELYKLSSELCHIRDCQGRILQMLTSDRLDNSTKYQDKIRAEPQSLSELHISDNSCLNLTPKLKFELSKVMSSDSREISENQDSNKDMLEGGGILPNKGSEINSFGECQSTSFLITHLPPIARATKVDYETLVHSPALSADVSFVESDFNRCETGKDAHFEQSREIQPIKSAPASPERKTSSRIRSLVERSYRRFRPQPHAAAVGSSVQSLFDDRLPHHRTVRKRILSCYGACGENSTINALWRKFLLATFEIQDDEVWTGKVGSAVIHPDSRFSRGEKRDGG